MAILTIRHITTYHYRRPVSVGNQDLVRVAVVREPREAIPLQGTWIGNASDHLAMRVAVKVKATADAGASIAAAP